MSEPYTPTTEEVRLAAASDDWGSGLPNEWFDRWLAEVKAELLKDLVLSHCDCDWLFGKVRKKCYLCESVEAYRQGEN